MKEKILAGVVLGVTLAFVIANTFILAGQTSEMISAVSAIDLEESDALLCKSEFERVYESFKRKEKYISITVNHEDLTNIEQSFAEIIGNLSVEDTDGATVIKYRLLDSLEHLRRLSGANLDSII